jgi:4-hydroxy-2-oxoheptanedioate aldolase
VAYSDLRTRLEAGETLYTAWSAIPDPLVAEFLARSAFDAVTLDMQHGSHTTDSILRGVAAVTLAGAPAIVRVPVGRFDMASRALDFGASAVIAPMVNSLADAKAFAAAMKFPPVGERSWGPTRMLALHGRSDVQHYLANGNSETLAIAMIETRAAQAILDDILAVDGIDGVFVGPSDFSIALSNGAKVDPTNAEMLKAAAEIAAKTIRAGKIPCTLGYTGESARAFAGMGFRLIAIGSDIGYLTGGANAAVALARGAA